MAVLLVNRAAAHLRLQQWHEAEADCTTAARHERFSVKAYMRRAAARMVMSEDQFQTALDVNEACQLLIRARDPRVMAVAEAERIKVTLGMVLDLIRDALGSLKFTSLISSAPVQALLNGFGAGSRVPTDPSLLGSGGHASALAGMAVAGDDKHVISFGDTGLHIPISGRQKAGAGAGAGAGAATAAGAGAGTAAGSSSTAAAAGGSSQGVAVGSSIGSSIDPEGVAATAKEQGNAAFRCVCVHGGDVCIHAIRICCVLSCCLWPWHTCCHCRLPFS